MFLMYVDESGDSGANTSITKFYLLSGMVVHEASWQTLLERMTRFRRRMKGLYQLHQNDEIHSSVFINGRLRSNHGVPRQNRLAILRALISEMSQACEIRLIHVVVDKRYKPANFDIFGAAWQALLQQFEQAMRSRYFPGSRMSTDMGLILPDDGNEDRLRHLLRKMRARHPIASGRPLTRPLQLIVEDPAHRNSEHSYFIQCVDVAAYFLQQYLDPNRYIRQQSARNYFRRLAPVLTLAANPNDPLGIVRI